jgi:type IV pilus secretin PilQ/predicted competence protein
MHLDTDPTRVTPLFRRPHVRLNVPGWFKVLAVMVAASLSQPVTHGQGSESAEPLLTAAAGQSDVVTLNADGVSMAQVLNAFSIQTGRSMVIGPDVEGTVNMRLKEVPWKEALEVVLRPYGYGYQSVGQTIIVNKLDKIREVEAVEGVVSRVFELKYIDAYDVSEIIKTQLSERGQVSVLASRGQKGWEFESSSNRSSSEGEGASSKRRRAADADELVKSKMLIVTDIPSVVTRVADILTEVDIKPAQILIEARFVEVDSNFLRDVGLEYGTGLTGAETPGVQPQFFQDGSELFGLGAQQLGGGVSPASFNEQSIGLSDLKPFNAGLSLMFQRLTDTQFQVLLHALQEDVSANMLSAPRILTMNNLEAAIIVGTKFPIISSDTSGDSATVSTTLEYYENIGVQLNVVPQVCDDDYINMVVHPAVSTQIGVASAKTGTERNTALTEYPVLSTREAESQILVRSGQTIVLGGLLEDRESVTELKIPFLGDIPVLGRLFQRRTRDVSKVDLLIFLTATIVDPDDDLHAALPQPEARAAEPEPVPAEDDGLARPAPAPERRPNPDPAVEHDEQAHERMEQALDELPARVARVRERALRAEDELKQSTDLLLSRLNGTMHGYRP